jgi:hypothetical protein
MTKRMTTRAATRVWRVAVLAGVAAIGLGGAAFACRCITYKSAADQLSAADVMFVGRVVASEPESGRLKTMRNLTEFAVLKTLKGEVSPTAEVLHEPGRAGSCGVSFRPGQTRIVLAHRNAEGGLETSGCDAPQFLLADYEAAR